MTKRRFFQGHRVPEYWVIDGDAAVFEIWRPDDQRGALVDDYVVWAPRTATPALEIDVRRFFADVADEPEAVG